MQRTVSGASSSRQMCHGGSSLSDYTKSGDRAAAPYSGTAGCAVT